MRFCENVLKKVGFDTQSFQTDLAISEAILSFNPDLIIMTAAGTRVNGVSYISKLKTKNKNIPVILVGTRNRLNVSDKQIVALLEPPMSPTLLVEVLANLFNLDEVSLLEKYEKSSDYKKAKDEKAIVVTGAEAESEESIKVRGKDTEVALRLFVEKNKQSPDKIKARSDRYNTIAVATALPPFIGMSKPLIQDQVRDFRESENSPTIAKIDEERRMFAIELARRYKN